MVVRRARVRDIPQIMELWDEFMKDHDAIIKRKRRLLSIEKLNRSPRYLRKRANSFRKNILSKNSAIYLSEIDGEVVGYIHAGLNKTRSGIGYTGYVYDIFVSKNFRGRGISSELNSVVEKWFKSRGVKYASLNIFIENEEAYKIYKKWGYFDLSIWMRKKL